MKSKIHEYIDPKIKSMSKKTIILLAIVTCGFSSCKKDYTCECSDNNGVYSSYKVRNTKKKAKTECDGYCTSCKYQSEGQCVLK